MTPPLPGESRDPKKVLIAIALNGKEAGMLRFETAFSFIKLACKDTGYEFEVIPMGGCDVCHARNLSMHHWRTRTNCGRMRSAKVRMNSLADTPAFAMRDC